MVRTLWILHSYAFETLPADAEAIGSSSWTDVPYFQEDRVSCSNLEAVEELHGNIH
jgi:hypothetical protein